MSAMLRILTGIVLGLWVVAGGLPAAAQHGESSRGFVLGGSIMPAIGNWVVLGASGSAWWRPQGEAEWRRFEIGAVLLPGSEIETGDDGGVTLVAGGDRLIVAPQGRLILPLTDVGQDRRLRQQRGHILVQVEDLGERDFRVDTPLLSLGIKGTTFEVFVGREENSVAVHEGEVAVTTRDAPVPIDIGTGEGLRQSATPRAGAERFRLPAVEMARRTTDAPVWLLPGPVAAAAELAQSGAIAAPFDDRRSVDPTRRRERTQVEAGRHSAALAGEAGSDERNGWGSSWILLAVAGATIAALTIPGMALFQNLRQQWLDRPVSKGKRRRELTRGW